MKNQKIIGAALCGFAAPLTVALASGVHYGDDSAGWFVAASWFCALMGIFLVKLAQTVEG